MPAGDLADILEKARRGDPEAAAAIARRFGRRIRVHLSRSLGASLRRRVDTEDLYQSTLQAALEGLPAMEYRDEESFRGWLRAVAENQVRMAARFHGAARRDVGRESPLPEPDARPSARTSPSRAAARAELTGDVREALARLPAEEREVVRLRSYEGLGFREIAERLGLADEDRARYLYRRGLQAMAGMVADHGEPAP